jgi:hypothetical protein
MREHDSLTAENSAEFVPRWSSGSFILLTDLSVTEINISAGNVLEATVKLFLCQNTVLSQRYFTSSEKRRKEMRLINESTPT